jgi:LmbE family N-acetylglucosaminyl deacetylase
MIASTIALHDGAPKRVLLLGAHSDDIEIGCGATLQALVEKYPGIELRWTVFSSTDERAAETKRAAALLLPRGSAIQFDIRSFRESYFPYIGAEIKDCVESIKREFSPDVIFTHAANDKHQDHRLISELTRNAYRDHLILEFEVMKYDGDLTSPNVFVPVLREQADKKVHALMDSFRSQRHKHWFTADAFMSLMRLRGIEANSPSGFAEAFFCQKLRLFQ